MNHENFLAHRARNEGNSLNDLCTKLFVFWSVVLVEASQQKIQRFFKMWIELFLDNNNSGSKSSHGVLLLDRDALLHEDGEFARD